MATIKDVAQRANVSKMTVSRVINHPELVTDELKRLVYQAMEELDYRPNIAAKALAQNRTLVVKVLILEEMDATEPYFMNLLTGVAKGLDKYQYSLQLMTENTIDKGGSDGYIITGMREDDYEWIKKIEKPVLLFGENHHGVPFVDSNNRLGAAQATQYAIQCGYQHIVFIGLDVPALFERQREAGYKDVMDLHPQLTSQQFRIENRSTAASNLIKSQQWPTNTCFVCGSDRIGIGVTRALRAMNLNIPEDFGVIGFDGVFLDQISSPQLTTMKQPIMEMGIACVDQLMKLIDGQPVTQTAYYFPTTLIKRESTR